MLALFLCTLYTIDIRGEELDGFLMWGKTVYSQYNNLNLYCSQDLETFHLNFGN